MLILAHAKQFFLSSRLKPNRQRIIAAQRGFELARVDGKRAVKISDRGRINLAGALLHVSKTHPDKLLQQDIVLLIKERDLSSGVDPCSDPAVGD